WIQLLSRQRDEFSESAVPLHAERFIELAGIRTVPQARRASATTCVGGESHIGSSGKRPAPFHNGSTHLMARNPRKRDQWIQPTKGIQIAPAEPNHSHFQQQVAIRRHWIGNSLDRRMARLLHYECLHISSTVVGLTRDAFRNA